MYMVLSLELSIFVRSRYIALKLRWRIWENDIKEGPRFAPSSKYLTNFKILELSFFLILYQLSRKLMKNLSRCKESFNNKELQKKFAHFL